MTRKTGVWALRVLAVWCAVVGPAGTGAVAVGGDQATCPPGFSGPGCTFCTWLSAGAACQPGSVRDLIDLDAIKAMTLEDLGWTLTSTRRENGVTVFFGDWSGGVLPTYTPEGEPIDVPLREAAAFYLPDGYPATANPGLGLVYAAHYTVNIDGPVPASIARLLGMPVLYHGEYPNWREAGYPDRGSITQATSVHLMRENSCYPTDLVRGHFPLALAHTDMLAITLLQRLAEVAGGTVSRVALRGFSKEGHAAWLAFLVDDRIEVGIPGGAQGQDAISQAQLKLAAYGCDAGSSTQEDVQALADGLYWKLHTPAGAASTNQFSVAHNLGLLHPRVFVIDGDVGMYNMHDGINGMPTGGESSFLDSLANRPWRYVRKAIVEEGADGEDGDVVSTTALPLLGAELLVAGPGSEAALYPDILETTAELTGDSFTVVATATACTELARVWWTWSEDMVFSEETQEPWTFVAMTAGAGGGWSSPPIAVPTGTVVAWYAEVANTITVGEKVHVRRHASPIRFLRPTPARTCEPLPMPPCPPVPRVRRHVHPVSR